MALVREYMMMSSGGSDGGELGERAVQTRSFLAMRSLHFGGRRDGGKGGGREVGGEGRGRRASFGSSTTQYHSLADGIGGRSRLPRKRSLSLEIPVLPMNVLKSSPSPVHC